MDFPIEFTSDHEAAEARHGEVKRACLDRINPGSVGRWGGGANDLATIAWEGGWDAALLEARRYEAMIDDVQEESFKVVQRHLNHALEAERSWQQRYEAQVQQTQDLDQRWQAKWREAQDALVKMKAERNEARADVVACMMAYRHKLPIDGGTLQRLDTYARGMSADQVGQVTYLETSLVSDPPDPFCALDQRIVAEVAKVNPEAADLATELLKRMEERE